MPEHSLVTALRDSARPVFLFGSTPPKEGTTLEKAKETCRKFAARSAVLATDGFIVYDIQEEGARTNLERPFPFRKTMDPALYASFFPMVSGKQCVVYKCVVEDSLNSFNKWLDVACDSLGHHAFNLVGASSSASQTKGPTLVEAGNSARARGGCGFGCVCIPERHTSKGNEEMNMLRKMEFGAEWFITQGIFAADATIKLLNEYGDACRARGLQPKKVILTFAPCGRPKTLTFIKWLGMHVPQAVEERIFAAAHPVDESVDVLCELLVQILEGTGASGVPLGVNVESLSIFKEEINAAFELFQRLQGTLLNSRGSPWSVRWFFVQPVFKYVPAHASSRSMDGLDALAIELPSSGQTDQGGPLSPSLSPAAQALKGLQGQVAELQQRVEELGASAREGRGDAFTISLVAAVGLAGVLGAVVGRLTARP